MSPEIASSAARSANQILEKTEHGNIRTAGAIEDIFKNLDRIPIDELEKFVAKFKP